MLKSKQLARTHWRPGAGVAFSVTDLDMKRPLPSNLALENNRKKEREGGQEVVLTAAAAWILRG